MGKVKQARQKFHLTRVKSMSDLTTIKPTPPTENYETQLPSISVATNLFADVDIPLSFDQTLDTERDLFDDAKSIVSTKSSFKDRNLTKKQKRTMRHNAFVQKLDIIAQARKAVADRRKNRNKKGKPVTTPTVTVPADSTAAPTLPVHAWTLPVQGSVMPESQGARVGTRKSLLKAKQRQKQALKDVGAFKKVLEDPEYRADPLSAIFNRVHQKIREELENE